MQPLNDPQFDAVQAERIELDTLIERGMDFTVPKRSILRRFGKPERTFVLQQPYLGTLDHLSRLTIDLDYSEESLQQEPFEESKRLAAANAKQCARIVAVAVLNSRWKIRLLTGVFSQYLLWRLTPRKLLHLTGLILQISNLMDFTGSIRFLSIKKRTTTPALIETPERKSPVAPLEQPD